MAGGIYNHCLAQCIRGINSAYGTEDGKKEEMFVFREVDFAKIAQEFGCVGFRIKQPDDIYPALQKAFSCDKPVMVDVVTEKNSLLWQFPNPLQYLTFNNPL